MSKSEYARRMAAQKKKVKAIIAHNNAMGARWNQCNAQMESGSIGGVARDTCIRNAAMQGLPDDLDLAIAGDRPYAITVTPREIAYSAIVRLRLDPPKPGIGPPPEINKWKIAAVGYPMWLWGDGTLDPPPVSQSVANLSVALDAKVDKIVFLMGDGQRVTCSGPQLDHPWGRWVEPGTPSPHCGYRYTKPSLPGGTYTVTAITHWRVDWEINGATGTEPLVQRSSVELPVGELQVVVR